MAGLTRRALVLSEIQASEGVDPLPSPLLNALLVSDMTFTVNGQVIERQFLRDSLSRIPHRMGRIIMEANFSFELKSGPALGARPEWSPLMRAGGFQETVDGAVTSIRTAALKWSASPAGGAGTFSVDLLGGGDPTIANPSVVREGGQDMPRGTISALKAGQFAYGDIDTLGFNTVYVRLTDAADPDSKAVDYLQAVAGVDIEYNLRDTLHEFATVYIYPDGLLIKMIDSIVDWTINFQAGQVPTVQCRVQSKYVTPTDVPIPAVVNYQSHLPPLAESMTFTMGAFATGVIPSVSVQSGTVINQREDINSPLGLKGTKYGGRSLTGTLTIEQELAATFNFFSKFDASSEQAITYKIGSTPQRIQFSMPNVQFGNISSVDLNGERGLTVPLLINEDLASGAKEFKMTLN